MAEKTGDHDSNGSEMAPAWTDRTRGDPSPGPCADDPRGTGATGQGERKREEASACRRRALRARMAAHALHAGVPDAAAHTAPARAAFLARFEREVDPTGALDPRERARRAEHARKAYFLRLALASAHARSKRRTPRRTATGDS